MWKGRFDEVETGEEELMGGICEEKSAVGRCGGKEERRGRRPGEKVEGKTCGKGVTEEGEGVIDVKL